MSIYLKYLVLFKCDCPVSVVAIAFVSLAFVKTAKGWSSSVIDAEYHVEEKDMAEPSDKQKISEMGLKQK